MELISIVTPTYNEEANVEQLHSKIKKIMQSLDEKYAYEHIFIDNCSEDKTVDILRQLAKNDKNVKIIVNSRNFGHIKSPYYGLLQASGDAVISIVADLQDPPEMIVDFLKKWEEGYPIVVGVKKTSAESSVMFSIRKLYYRTVNKLSNIELINNFTGFGLYDKKVIEILKNINEPYPYFRGLISEVGFEKYKIEYDQPERKRGITKNNFYTLYDIGMLGLISHSKVPLRVATMLGFVLSLLSIMVAIIYLILKIVYWDIFSMGTAPIIIGLFFFASVQLFFIGIIGEYIGSLHTYAQKRDLVIEKERINFD